MVISQLRLVGSHNTNLGAPWNYTCSNLGGAIFLVTLVCLDMSSKKKVPIETFHISSESTHNKQQAGNRSICTEERGEKL